VIAGSSINKEDNGVPHMNIEVEELLHPRVISHCNKLLHDAHYKHAALEAMIQVELALKEKSGVNNLYGASLCTTLFGKGRGIKLRVPLGEDVQSQAEQLFKAAFGYYRNNAAHEGSKIDRRICIRIMVLASELLDLVGASSLSYADVGGVEGLVKAGLFRNAKAVGRLLSFVEGHIILDMDANGFSERYIGNGFSDDQVQALIDLGLIEYREENHTPSMEELEAGDSFPDTIGRFELTLLGDDIAAKYK